MPEKPFDHLSKSGKWLRRMREEDPKRYEERKRKQRERERERKRRMREEGPQAYAEYLKRQRESKRRHPETVRRHTARRKEQYQTDPEYRDHKLTSKREWYNKQREENSESYQRQRKVASRYALIFRRSLQILLVLKKGGACERCPCNDIRCLEVHHPNEDASRRRRDDYRKMLMGEMEYEVLCANCHRVEHFEPLNAVPLTQRQAELLLHVQEASS